MQWTNTWRLFYWVALGNKVFQRSSLVPQSGVKVSLKVLSMGWPWCVMRRLQNIYQEANNSQCHHTTSIEHWQFTLTSEFPWFLFLPCSLMKNSSAPLSQHLSQHLLSLQSTTPRPPSPPPLYMIISSPPTSNPVVGNLNSERAMEDEERVA